MIGAEAEKQSMPELKEWIVDATTAISTGASARAVGSTHLVICWFIVAVISSHLYTS